MTDTVPLPFQLSRLVTTMWIPQAVYAAAELGVADALAGGPKTSARLARELGVHPGALHRLLRGLAGVGVVEDRAEGFTLTSLGACLCAESPTSMHAWIRVWGGYSWARYAHFVECVRTGKTARELRGEGDTFDAMESGNPLTDTFDRSMVELTRLLAPGLLEVYDFSSAGRVLDVGGGWGEMLAAVLTAHPDARGAVFDLPRCADGARRWLASRGVAARSTFIAGDFFRAVPSGFDTYVLKHCIHDWDDARSVVILRTIAAAMHPGATLLLVELLAPEQVGGAEDLAVVGTDLNMMLMTGGRERTETEHRRLLDEAGLTLSRVVPAGGPMAVLEARHR